MHVAAYFAARSDFSLLSDIFLKVSTRSSLDLLHWGGGGGGGDVVYCKLEIMVVTVT